MADLMAITAIKEFYGETHKDELNVFMKKFRFFALSTSAYIYSKGKPDFRGIIFKYGIEMPLSYSFKPHDLTKMIIKSEELEKEAFIYLNPIYSEEEIKKQYNHIKIICNVI